MQGRIPPELKIHPEKIATMFDSESEDEIYSQPPTEIHQTSKHDSRRQHNCQHGGSHRILNNTRISSHRIHDASIQIWVCVRPEAARHLRLQQLGTDADFHRLWQRF
ncbi:hypothetical protein Pcinc_037752 [Petrolisthes cinctipes]|uniref:Uncharacterized protein n=1 Tax=Petrolisthes cinctipes TaxID=88211 RepID=A0AAE1BTE2_PETCI|nr:hypothetical protein Pcinc_037752 [Petrolisthes cinctipes]